MEDISKPASLNVAKPTTGNVPKPTSISATRIVRRAPLAAAPKKRINYWLMLLSLVIGSLLWFGVDLYRMREKIFDVDIDYESQLPADWKFLSVPQKTIKLKLRGPNQVVENLSRDQISLEVEYPKNALEGDSYDGGINLQPSFLHNLPAGVEVLSFEPSVIKVRLSKLITRYITVAAGDIVGTPQEGYTVGKVHQIDPPAMAISASREFLSKISPSDVIHTRPFNVDNGKGLVGGMIALEPFEKDGENVNVPGVVYMTVELDEIPAERRFDTPFEVRALIDAPFDRFDRLNISPPSVTVTASGPKTVVDKLGMGEIVIYADMKDRIPAAAGEFNIKLKAITPARVRVAKIEPDTVKWIAVPPPSPAPSPSPAAVPASGLEKDTEKKAES